MQCRAAADRQCHAGLHLLFEIARHRMSDRAFQIVGFLRGGHHDGAFQAPALFQLPLQRHLFGRVGIDGGHHHVVLGAGGQRAHHLHAADIKQAGYLLLRQALHMVEPGHFHIDVCGRQRRLISRLLFPFARHGGDSLSHRVKVLAQCSARRGGVAGRKARNFIAFFCY